MNSLRNIRLLLWMWLTQRNGKGPIKYLGLLAIEWLGLAAVTACVVLGYWLLWKLYVSMAGLAFYR